MDAKNQKRLKVRGVQEECACSERSVICMFGDTKPKSGIRALPTHRSNLANSTMAFFPRFMTHTVEDVLGLPRKCKRWLHVSFVCN